MKTFILISLLFLSTGFSSTLIEDVDLINTKWEIKNENSSSVIVYFKYDSSYWHYYSHRNMLDSTHVGTWKLVKDRICIFADSTVSVSQIIYLTETNMKIKNVKTNGIIDYSRTN